MTFDLSRQPWWTEADDAELDLLVHEFVRVVDIHRERCSICSANGHCGPWCAPLREALEGVVEWRAGRILRSKAQWLRMRQTEVEEWAA